MTSAGPRAVPRPAAGADHGAPPGPAGFVGGLLAGIAADAFLATCYGRRPFAAPGGAAGFAATFDWPRFDALLATADDVIASRDGALVDTRYATADHALADRVALALRHVERHDRALALIAAQAAADLRGPVDVHVHATPAGARGFAWHADAEEVFVVQCAGAKRWRLRANTTHPDPLDECLPAAADLDAETSPIHECRLEQGDWLYVPGGWWHATDAVAQHSLSIAIGVHAATPLAALDRLRRELVADPRWRRRLPPIGVPGADAVWSSSLDEAAAELARWLREPALRMMLASDDAARVRALIRDEPRG